MEPAEVRGFRSVSWGARVVLRTAGVSFRRVRFVGSGRVDYQMRMVNVRMVDWKAASRAASRGLAARFPGPRPGRCSSRCGPGLPSSTLPPPPPRGPVRRV